MSSLQVVELVLLAGFVLIALWVFLMWLRRRSLAAHGPISPSAVGLPGAPRWRLGLLRLSTYELDWFSLGGVTTRPTISWSRDDLDISTPGTDPPSIPGLPGAVVVRLTLAGQPLAELALEAKFYPALRSWLESAPPGHNVNVT